MQPVELLRARCELRVGVGQVVERTQVVVHAEIPREQVAGRGPDAPAEGAIRAQRERQPRFLHGTGLPHPERHGLSLHPEGLGQGAAVDDLLALGGPEPFDEGQ